jgi:hypothetical protein
VRGFFFFSLFSVTTSQLSQQRRKVSIWVDGGFFFEIQSVLKDRLAAAAAKLRA